MSVNVFPAPSTGGGGGGGSNLPEGAVSQVVQGKLTATGFDYPEALAAGTYLVNVNGNAVNAVLGDAGITKTISGTGALTLASNETNLSFGLAENFGGVPIALTGAFPQPTVNNFGQVYGHARGFAVDPVNGNMLLSRGNYSADSQVAFGFRNPTGLVQKNQVLNMTDNRYMGTAVDSLGNFYVSFRDTNGLYKVAKYNGETNVISYLYLGNVNPWFNDGSGVSGMAVSADGQTITVLGNNEAKAITSVNAGSTWTNVSLPATPQGVGGYQQAKVKLQEGSFFAKTNTNGQFLYSTDALTWLSYTIPGAVDRVSSFAYDGTTFMFATGNQNLLYKCTTLGTFSSITLPTSNVANGITHVEYGDGKWAATNGGIATSTHNFYISEDGVIFFIIDDTASFMKYGNTRGCGNANFGTSTASSVQVQGQISIQHLLWDPKYKTFVASANFQGQSAMQVMDCLNIDHTNYYKWYYSHNQGPSAQDYSPPLDSLTYSNYFERYYYSSSNVDGYGQQLMFSYDPITENVRTEPLGNTFANLPQQSSGITGQGQGNKMVLDTGRAFYSFNYSGLRLAYQTHTDPAIFWGVQAVLFSAQLTNTNNLFKPVKFPDGSAAFFQIGYQAQSQYMVSAAISAAGGAVSLGMYQGQDTLFGAAMASGKYKFDTVAKTFYCYANAVVWKDLPYPLPSNFNSILFSSRVNLPAGNNFYYKEGDTTISQNSTLGTISISTNDGFTSQTFSSPGVVTGIVEKQGVYYLLCTYRGETVTAKTSDFITYEYLDTLGISEVWDLWDAKDGRPNGSIDNPTIMDITGKTVQLFTDTQLQPEANVFVYDMNLQEL